jgi:hypothetical protein
METGRIWAQKFGKYANKLLTLSENRIVNLAGMLFPYTHQAVYNPSEWYSTINQVVSSWDYFMPC